MALFAALARAARQRLGESSPYALANKAWAFATAIQRDVALFVALARAAQRRLGEYSPQQLANTAWAIAMTT